MAKVKLNTDMSKKLKRSINKLTNKNIHVGFLNNTPHEGGRSDNVSNASLAYLQEMGAPSVNIPSRPFMSQSVGSDVEVRRLLRSISKRVLKDPTKSMDTLGASLVDLIKEVMEGGDFEDNKPSTVKKKGYNNPLIETRSLLSAVDYELRPKEK